MNEDINSRFLLLIKRLGMNNNSFSKKLGLINGTAIGNIVGGRKNKPSFDLIFKIISTFDYINSDWLITGRGEMFNTPQKNEGLTVVNEPALPYGKKCFECDRKQEVIEMQRQRLETLNMLVESKNELIELLKGENKGNVSRACG
jgi:hypothetical protein